VLLPEHAELLLTGVEGLAIGAGKFLGNQHVEEGEAAHLLHFVRFKRDAGLPVFSPDMTRVVLAALAEEGLQLLDVVDEDTWDEHFEAFWHRNKMQMHRERPLRRSPRWSHRVVL